MANKTKSTKPGYFDINIDNADNQTTLAVDISDIFYVQDLKQRKIWFSEPIFQENVDDLVHHILQFNKEDKDIPVEDRQPILLYFTSSGGSVDVGFQLIDVITCSRTPVYIINTGYQYSMGFLVGLAGHKRFATKNAKFLMHDGTSMAFDSSAKVNDIVEFRRKEEKRIKAFVLSRSNITEELYDKQFRVEWYMYGDEAKEMGFVDYVIGEDCSIDDIV